MIVLCILKCYHQVQTYKIIMSEGWVILLVLTVLIAIISLFQTSMSRSSFSVIVRWAAFSPLANFDGPDHTIELVGGPVHNPENMLVFYCQSDETIASSANLAGLTGGHLNFSFSSTKMVSMLVRILSSPI